MNDIEKNSSINETNVLAKKDIFYFKILVSILLLILVGPFIICDMYYALNDTTCVN
jgi:hypothetical protein